MRSANWLVSVSKLMATMLFLFMFSQPLQASSMQACEFSPINTSFSRDAVHTQYGKPDEVVGSGLVIDVYKIADGSEVWIGWKNSQGSLLYVQHIGAVLDHPAACS